MRRARSRKSSGVRGILTASKHAGLGLAAGFDEGEGLAVAVEHGAGTVVGRETRDPAVFGGGAVGDVDGNEVGDHNGVLIDGEEGVEDALAPSVEFGRLVVPRRV